jgi:subtilase family serine protease
MQPDAIFLRQASTTNSTTVEGYTPAQISTAYGFDSATFGSSSTAANGAGQTIAIIDAYNDPDITADLNVFDSEFNLASANLTVVNQTGGSTLPANNASWAGEIALDVEWAHAIAPAAHILLIETNSDNTDDLMAGVIYARTVPSVSVVSMSWGGSEYFSWGDGGESTSQTALDADFTTPAGHQGITFVAAAGDSGSQSGVQWPASSPNVVAVGGTTLTLNSDGTYSSESGWNGTSGGYSQVETEPTYQDIVQSTGYRSVPDVAYDADPNTGVAVYDSDPYEGVSGWQEVGGTSEGAPQWAALIAIADQGRVIDGKSTLDGASQTLPDLYDLYSDPGTSAYDTYTTYFNDVENDGHGGVGFRWGGYGRGQGQTGIGYDTITGLGTPHAADVIDALDGDSSTGSTGGTTSGNGSSGTTMPSSVPASPVSITFVTQPVSSVIGGTAGSLEVELTNTSGTQFQGPLTITLYASTDNTLSSDDTAITTLSIKSVTIKAGGTKSYKLKFDYPSTLSTGSYDLIASVQATATDDASAQAVSASTVAITAPTVDLSTSFAGQTAVTVRPGKKGSVVVTITNQGNVTAAGTLDLLLYASTTGLIDTSSTLLTSITNRKIKIKAGKSLKISLNFKAPTDLTGGTYSLIASATASTIPANSDTTNNTATIATLPPV